MNGNKASSCGQMSPTFRCPVLPENSSGYGYSSKSIFLSRADGDDATKDQEVQETSMWQMLSLEKAFASLEQSSELPSVESLTCIVQNCIKKKNLTHARRVHMHILVNGLETNSTLGNHLVPMFVECGSVPTAQQVFHRLPQRNVHSWTYLIQASIDHGECQQALDLFQKMEEDCVRPNKYSLQALLKACARLKCAERGRAIHGEIVKEGFDRDPFVGSTLIDMYAKSGSLGEAQIVFDELLVRDVVSWTALISGYAENGLSEEALHSFQQMQSEGVTPNAVTFICSLKACGTIGDIDRGREAHTEIAKEGFEQDSFVGSALVDMYAKCGSLEEAWQVFNELQYRDVVLWTAIIAGYAEHGFGKEALDCLEQMQMDGFSPNAVTSVCSLKACGSLGSIVKGRRIHIGIVKEGFDGDSFVNTALVDMYSKCGSSTEALDVFDKLAVRDLVSWNALIAGFAEHKHGEEAWKCLEQMQMEGLSPDPVTLVCTLKACGNTGLVDKGQLLHTEVAKDGFEEDPFVGISLLDMYAKCGLLREAHDVFDELPVQDVVSWNALITGYAEHGLGEEALNCLKKMHQEGVPLDAITAVCSLKACVAIGAIDKGRWIHLETVKQGLVERDPIVGNALVDMYAKCNSLVEAQVVFDRLPRRDVVSWGALLLGYACQGQSELVFCLFDQMVEEGIHPDGISILSVLTVCSHAGLVDKGLKYFNAMSKEYGIVPTVEHHNCMVDLLSRAGQLDQAVSMLDKMPCQPNIVTWSTVLGACRKCGDVELARRAFNCAVRLDDKEGASFILMAGIYADNNMWEDMEQLEAMVMSS